MIWGLVILATIPAAFGAYLVLDFVVWRLQGRITRGVIKGFAQTKSRFMSLPIVVFEDEKGAQHEAQAGRIDQLMFIFNRPRAENSTVIIYQKDNPKTMRVYGYVNIVAALFLCAPLLVALALRLQDNQALAQVFYAVIFGGIVIGGWVALKLIQRLY